MKFKYTDIDTITNQKTKKPFLVFAEHIEDPRNLGAIIRTAEGLGVHGIVIPNVRTCEVTDTVIKTSKESALRIPIAKVSNLAYLAKNLKDKGFWIAGLDIRGQDSVFDIPVSIEPIILVVGNENKGITKTMFKLLDVVIRIPMKNDLNSLNVSVAFGIAGYKIYQKRIENKINW